VAWLVQSCVLEEGPNRGQSAIAAAGGIAPIVLKVVKEGADKGGIQIRQG
jgi:hypothetical protein